MFCVPHNVHGGQDLPTDVNTSSQPRLPYWFSTTPASFTTFIVCVKVTGSVYDMTSSAVMIISDSFHNCINGRDNQVSEEGTAITMKNNYRELVRWVHISRVNSFHHLTHVNIPHNSEHYALYCLLFKTSVLEIRFCLGLQMEPIQVGPIEICSLCLWTWRLRHNPQSLKRRVFK
jgi:hypothetical protein